MLVAGIQGYLVLVVTDRPQTPEGGSCIYYCVVCNFAAELVDGSCRTDQTVIYGGMADFHLSGEVRFRRRTLLDKQ